MIAGESRGTSKLVGAPKVDEARATKAAKGVVNSIVPKERRVKDRTADEKLPVGARRLIQALYKTKPRVKTEGGDLSVQG